MVTLNRKKEINIMNRQPLHKHLNEGLTHNIADKLSDLIDINQLHAINVVGFDTKDILSFFSTEDNEQKLQTLKKLQSQIAFYTILVDLLIDEGMFSVEEWNNIRSEGDTRYIDRIIQLNTELLEYLVTKNGNAARKKEQQVLDFFGQITNLIVLQENNNVLVCNMRTMKYEALTIDTARDSLLLLGKMVNVSKTMTSEGLQSELRAVAKQVSVSELNKNVIAYPDCNLGFDLVTFVERKTTPADFITRTLMIHPNLNSPEPEVLKSTLHDIFESDTTERSFLNAMTNVLDYRSVKAQQAVFLHGVGSNGKSLLINTLVYQLCGKENIASTGISELGGPFGLAPLVKNGIPVQAMCSNENAGGWSDLSKSYFKQITAGESLLINEKNVSQYSINDTSISILLSFNNLPSMSSETDFAVLRRIRLFPFYKSFSGNEANPNLQAELLKELPDIAGMLLLNLQKMAANNYNVEETNMMVDAKYTWLKKSGDSRTAMDDFVKQYIEIANTLDAPKVFQPQLMKKYRQKMLEEGAKTYGTQSFKNAFVQSLSSVLQANTELKKSNGTRYYSGITWKGEGNEKL